MTSPDLSARLNYEREAERQFVFAVVALQGEAEASATVTVLVTDSNDNAPEFERDTFRWGRGTLRRRLATRSHGRLGATSLLYPALSTYMYGNYTTDLYIPWGRGLWR